MRKARTGVFLLPGGLVCLLALASAWAVTVSSDFGHPLGTSAMRYGVNEHYYGITDGSTAWQISREGGTQVIRAWIDSTLFGAGFSSSPDTWNWYLFDNFMYAVNQCNAVPMICFAGVPAWLSNDGGTYTTSRPVDNDQYGLWAAEIARHARDVLGYDITTWYWELWNEPNNAGVSGPMPASEYIDLYDAWAARMREVSPDLKLGGPSTDGPDYTYISNLLVDSDVQFITWHRYGAWDPGFTQPDSYYISRAYVYQTEAANVRNWINFFRPGEGIENICGELNFNAAYSPVDPRVWEMVNAPFYSIAMRGLILAGAHLEMFYVGTTMYGGHAFGLWNWQQDRSPAYWAKTLFKDHVPAGSTLYATSVGDPNELEALAAVSPAGDYTTIVINKVDYPVSVTVNLSGYIAGGGWLKVVDAASVADEEVRKTALAFGNEHTFTLDSYGVAALVTHPAAGSGTIEGYVTSSTGGLIQDALVTATGPYTASDQTDSDGFYRIQGIPAGTYTVTATHMNYDNASQEGVVVPEWGTATVDLVMGSLAVTSPPGWLSAGWNLVSIPRQPVDTRVEVVLDDLAEAGNPLLLYRYRRLIGYQAYPVDFFDIEAGLGYWLSVVNPVPVTYNGHRTTEAVALGLWSGWNLIGHPFDEAVPLADCTVTRQGNTLPYAEAVAAGWIDATLYYYEDSAYRTLRISGGADDQLRPWKGYWVKAPAGTVTLNIPCVGE